MRIFFKTLLISCLLLLAGCGRSDDEETIPLTIHEETLDVEGIDKEHKVFFIADSHISMCDDRDKELMEHAALRAMSFTKDNISAQDHFDALIRQSNRGSYEMTLLGGDIIDSALYASIDHVKEQLDSLKSPYLFLMGNHDFEYGTEYFSEKAYSDYLPRLKEMRGDKSYQIVEKEDYVIFTADDNNNQISQESLDGYKEAAGLGKPVLVTLHVPIEPITGDMTLVEKCKEVWGASADNRSRVTMGINGCIPNEVTKEFIDLLLADDSPVVLVLAGHIHFYHRDMLNDKVLQIVTGAAFEGEAVEITLK